MLGFVSAPLEDGKQWAETKKLRALCLKFAKLSEFGRSSSGLSGDVL